MDEATLATTPREAGWNEVQGLVTRGYKRLPSGRYLLLRIVDRERAKAWLAAHAGDVRTAAEEPTERAFNVALTAPGLRALGVLPAELATFSNPFQEGMVTPHRSRVLGDHGPNAPEHWRWGNDPENLPHALLAVFGLDDATVADECRRRFEPSAFALLPDGEMEATLPIERDHFNFADGLSQPRIKGLGTVEGIEPGEFVLGPLNERNQRFPVPRVGDAEEAFGLDGTYLVFRQMDQDVKGFHDYCRGVDPQNPEWVGSRLVGRWPDGTPLIPGPDGRPLQRKDSFEYGRDPDGLQCPLGSHVRRANPRDGLRNPGETINEASRKESRHTVAHHRLMRRGRVYGPLWREGTPYEDHPRGLHFLCVNASIEDGFELVQQSWLSSTKFDGLYDEVDPMVGISQAANGNCAFTVQRETARRRLEDIPRFITVRGGAYFFLPSRRALALLAALP